MDGTPGNAGLDGEAGATGFGIEPNCQANGAVCPVPEAGASALGLVAIATCAALRRRRFRF
jgi:hypothetical protein